MGSMISRLIKNQLVKSLKPGRVTGLFGARRTGKTYLLETIKNEMKDKSVLMVQGDNLEVAEILSSQRLGILTSFLKGYNFLFIDEAQKIPKIGVNLKLIVDNIKNIGVLMTGSSSLDLKQKVGEPLTGRSEYFYLYPFAQAELNENFLEMKQNLENRLVFGSYPQVHIASSKDEKIKTLVSIRDGYMLKDVLELDNLKDSLFILNLLRLIAFQIGNDISYSEISSQLNVNKKTVMRYLDILEKCYILYSLYGFSRNLRKEYTRTPRYFFLDNGIRNVLISNFNPLNQRDDIGKLWENFCITERLKINRYSNTLVNSFFWRTYDQQEIDLLEEKGGKLFGYEFKWSKQHTKIPSDFLKSYPHSKFTVINQENYHEFLLLKNE